MLWRGGRRSDNIEDRRGAGGGFGGGLGGGGFGGGRMVGGGLGLIVIVVIGLFFGVDPTTLLSQLEGGDAGYQQDAGTVGTSPQDDEAKQFVSVVLADTEDTWSAIFQQEKWGSYQAPRLVLFSGRTGTGCGTGQAAMGPFYCPNDSQVYIDLSFYEELKQRFQAPGDFAQAYVIAHEIGHHVQHLLGLTDEIERMHGGSQSGADSASVRIELQADCFAGVWAYHANQRQVVEPGDVAEALNAATAIGDDKLQEESQGTVVPDSFTHGTSAQRVRWFKRGMQSGDPNACDTANAKNL